MNKYTIYCTREQTKKALELGAPIEPQTSSTLIDTLCAFCDDGWYIIPTAEQMLGWLRKNKLYIEVMMNDTDTERHFDGFVFISTTDEALLPTIKETYEDALLSAIDNALEYLTNNKK